MPILDPSTNTALIALGGEYFSSLPPPRVQSGSVNPVFASLTHADFGATHLEDALRLGALTDRNVAISTGWPALELDAFVDLIDVALENIDPDTIADALEALGEAAELFSDLSRTIADAISGVPILGWIIQVGLVVWDIVQIARFRAPEMTSNKPIAYDLSADEFVSDRLLARVQSRDWTVIFSPQPGSFVLQDLAYTNAGAADGFQWGQLGWESDELGLLPGIGAIAGYWQSPRKVPGSNRDANVVNVVANNQLLPSAVSLSGLLWTANQAPGPMLARIDLHALASQWDDYGADLEDFADSRSGIQRKQIRNGWRWLDETYNSPLYGVESSDVPAEFRGWGLQNLVAWRLELARQAVRANMKTIAVAYVPPDAPGLSDASTHEAWADARWRLLVHNARADVDASIIPDAEYREAMVDAQKWGMPAELLVKPPGQNGAKHPGLSAIDGLLGKEPDDPYLPLPPGEGAGGPPEGPKAGGGAVVGGLIAILTVWALAKRRGRR